MAALERLCDFMGINSKKFTKDEIFILEAELYTRVHDEIWELYKLQHKDYFYLFKFNDKMERILMELHIIRCFIHDLLKSKAYTLPGISYYTQTPEEIVKELFIGNKINSIILFPRKLIELHKSVRTEVYQNVIKKISNAEN